MTRTAPTVKAISQPEMIQLDIPEYTQQTLLWEPDGMSVPGPGTFPQWGVIPTTEPQLLGSTDICDSP